MIKTQKLLDSPETIKTQKRKEALDTLKMQEALQARDFLKILETQKNLLQKKISPRETQRAQTRQTTRFLVKTQLLNV